MGDVPATRSDLSTASYRRYLRVSHAFVRTRNRLSRRSAIALPAAAGALLLGALLPTPALAEPAQAPPASATTPAAAPAPAPAPTPAPAPAPASAPAAEIAPAPATAPLPEGPLVVAPTPTPSLMPQPGTRPPAPAPDASPQVVELSAGSTLLPVGPVPVGGEVGLIWGPGWTDFQVTGMGGVYAGAKVNAESRPAREPGWSGEAKVTGVAGPFRAEGTATTDLGSLDLSGKVNAGPWFGGASGQLLPTPQFDGFRGGYQQRFSNSMVGLGAVGAAGPRWTSPRVNLYDTVRGWLGLDAPATPPAEAPAPTPPAIDPPLLDAPLPPTDTPPTEAPPAEAPVVETPAADAPAVETPAIDPPLLDAPLPPTGSPAVEAPVIEPAPLPEPAPIIEPPAPVFETAPVIEPAPAIAPPMPAIEPLPTFEPAPISPIAPSYDPLSTLDTSLDTSFATGLGDTGLSSFDSGLGDTSVSSFDSSFSSLDSGGGFSGGGGE